MEYYPMKTLMSLSLSLPPSISTKILRDEKFPRPEVGPVIKALILSGKEGSGGGRLYNHLQPNLCRRQTCPSSRLFSPTFFSIYTSLNFPRM